MKEKLTVPESFTGELWFYSKEGFLDHSHQAFLHRHDELELNLVVQGRGIYLLNSCKIEIKPNSMVWLFPEQEHLLVEKSLDFEMWILVVKPSYLREICTDHNSQVLLKDNPEGNFCRNLSNSQFQKLTGYCRDMFAVKNDRALFNASIGFILLAAWAAYQAANSASLVKNINPVIDKVTKLIIDGRGADELSCLAREVGLSSNSLSRIFKKEVGISLTTFRNRCRVEQFLDLYGDGRTLTMLDAAFEAGFGSYAQFYRVFTKTMGGNPSDYRRDLMNPPLNPHSPYAVSRTAAPTNAVQ